MPLVWNIGNTTVRNPKRIESALKVFFEEGFSGNAMGSEAEQRLHAKLKEKNILDFDGDASDFIGRKWRAAFYQLGFISYRVYTIGQTRYTTKEFFEVLGNRTIVSPYEITTSGRKLIGAQSITEIEDIYTRQFCCYEIPNTLEHNFPEGKMKPFILFIQVLKKLQDAGADGLNKFETGLFIQRFRDHTPTLANEIFDEICDFRNRLAACTGAAEIREFKALQLEELGQRININPESVVSDYADTSFRYFSLSGIFTNIGNRLVIRDNKIDFVNNLLVSEPVCYFNQSPIDYFKHFYNNTYVIPTDDKAIALREIRFLATSIRNPENPLLERVRLISETDTYEEIQRLRYDLIEYNLHERESDYAVQQQSQPEIEETLIYLRVLNNERIENAPFIDDKPAYFEWAVWRSFLAINNIVNPVHETRRFPIDQDFKPRNTAPGGGSDLIFEFEHYVLVVEVTLTTSHRQMAVESEPVRRHTVQYKELFPHKEVYCLFIAPSVDNNIVENFRIGVWYKNDDEVFINIIPMTLADFINTIEKLRNNRYNNMDFLMLLSRCLNFRNHRAPLWKSNITQEVLRWLNI